MEEIRRTLDTGTLVSAYRELLEEADTLPLVVTGNSMAPFLVHDRDTVYLKKPDRPLRRGDMALYERQRGTYVLHRVSRVDGQLYTMVGDGQLTEEPGISEQQVIAVVAAVERKGRRCAPSSPIWWFYERVWVRMIPLRPWFLRVRHIFFRKERVKHEGIR